MINNEIKNNKNKKIIKNKQKNIKKSLKNVQFLNIFKDMYDWLSGIQEDEPMPLEVNYIYFILEFTQNDIVFSYSGDETLLKVFDYGFYSPLEGQYLYSTHLKIIAKDFFANQKSISKTYIFNMLKTIAFNVSKRLWFTKEKVVLFGFRFDKIKL